MESYLPPVGGFGLPFGRRLSRLYSDTKKSSEFVKDSFQNEEDPDIKTLHRKLRIQKDRLVSWGLEWSDPNHSAEIDESLSKAGISDLVGSIMTTVKDILAEAEPLWMNYKRPGGEKGTGKAPVDLKTSLIVWDKGRFEDLVRDLTASIDTLYDLSRTRSTGIAATAAAAASPSPLAVPPAEESRVFESSRIQTPQEIDPKTLINATTMNSSSLILGNGNRDVVFMSKKAYSDLTYNSRPWAPLLLEYAEFDPIYAATGIMPSMAKFEKLCAGLQTNTSRQAGSWNGLPTLLGFFEDMQHARLGLVYQLPATFSPVSQSKGRQNTCSLFSLADLLARPDFEPTLEAKFRLANNLANTIFDMHARGVSHGNLSDQTVLFCNSPSTNEIDVRKPVVSSFDVFLESQYENSRRQPSLYRHPLDPRVTSASPLSESGENKALDLYALAMILSSIATWCSLENLVPNSASPSVPESILPQIAIRCGTLYMKAVQTCWTTVDEELAGKTTGDALIEKADKVVSRYLEACCILDSVNGLEDRMLDDLGKHRARAGSSAPAAGPSSKELSPMVPPKLRAEGKPLPSLPRDDNKLAKPVPQQPSEWPLDVKRGIKVEQVDIAPAKKTPKTRLYPNIPLPESAIEQWNTFIMPQVNSALRSFYKKNPESVEISLESIGESPHDARPTVLVVCTSVAKVRAILKKKLGGLFDGSTQFSLRVCKGQVFRSRKLYPRRCMGGSKTSLCESAVSNQTFQARPHNGASIGAWVGDRHLPPVSFGGLIVVDDKSYGMTVHHMLDDPDQEALNQPEQALRSIGGWGNYPESSYAESISVSEDCACEFSDNEDEDYEESDITSDDEDDDEDDFEAGDVPGVEPGCGDEYIVTQPALDDVEDNFFASEETADEEHLDCFSLGNMYASSGIRRRERHGLVHEIDWALFQFNQDRLPQENSIPRLEPNQTATPGAMNNIRPTAVAPTSGLPGLEVQCIARSSGLQTGTIMPALTSVKIYGRTSPSDTYQVCHSTSAFPLEACAYPLGIPGDSGAWIIDCRQGRLCGHVLAWSERKRVAYICPMDVLLLDIAETLDATEVKLPGGSTVVQIEDAVVVEQEEAEKSRQLAGNNDGLNLVDSVDEEPDDVPFLVDLSGTAPGNAMTVGGVKTASKGAPTARVTSAELEPEWKPGFERVEVRSLERGVKRMKLVDDAAPSSRRF